MTGIALDKLTEAVRASWSRKTARQWTPDNPAAGQCNVTAIVLQELASGDILKTRIGEFWHFYNRIGGERLDLTDCQFTTPIAYDDLPSAAEDAFKGVSEEEYQAMKQAVAQRLD